MTTYDITVNVDDRDAPGLRRMTDMIYDGMLKLGAREGNVEVDVHGPLEINIGLVPR